MMKNKKNKSTNFIKVNFLSKRSSWAFAAAVISIIWVGITAKYIENRQWDYSSAKQTMSNFTLLSEENVQRSIGEIDKALLYIRKTIEAKRNHTDYNTIVRTTDLLSEIIVQVAIIDATGMMRASNVGPNPSPLIDLSDRKHYRVHVNSNSDFLYISAPVFGRSSKKWSVQFTRRLRNRDGSFGGVVVASLNPAHFSKIYGEIDLGPRASISMIGSDGIVRSSASRSGKPRFELGETLAGTPAMKPMIKADQGIFEYKLQHDDEQRMTAFRKVAGHPLLVTVSQPVNAIYTSANTNLAYQSLAGVLLSILTLLASGWIGRAERTAQSTGRQLVTTLRQMSQGIMMVNDEQNIAVMNAKCLELLGLEKSEIPELAGSSKLPPEAKHEIPYRALARRAGLPLTIDDDHGFEHKTKVGRILEVSTKFMNSGGFVSTFSDITERKAAELHVTRLASKDSLTGILNRRVFMNELRASLQASSTTNNAVSVFLIDIDRFKFVNDSLGHVAGDALLVALADRLRDKTRKDTVIARLGGDEFALLMTVDDPKRATVVADNLLQQINGVYTINENQVAMTVSVGVAVTPADGETAEDLLVAADLALYAAKAEGRATFRRYCTEMNDAACERRKLEANLVTALENNEFELHFQPIIDLQTGIPVAMEALVRWHHPVDGLISPAAFIPAAEDTGLIIPLGVHILNEACRNAVAWPGRQKVCVNLSPVQFLSDDLVNTVMSALQNSGLEPARLELEITESALMKNDKRTIETLHRLKALGVAIAMDDFGTGYSSLSYLQSFPFDKIKVDRSFVSRLGKDKQSDAIVRAVVDIARHGGMRTTAEGIETNTQQVAVESMGCDEGQGYRFSRPIPSQDVCTALKSMSETQRTAA